VIWKNIHEKQPYGPKKKKRGKRGNSKGTWGSHPRRFTMIEQNKLLLRVISFHVTTRVKEKVIEFPAWVF